MSGGRRFLVALLIAVLAIVLPTRCNGQDALRRVVSLVSDSATRAQLQDLYAGWSWRLLWQGEPGAAARTDTLLAWLERAADDGLDPADYNAAALRASRDGAGDDSARVVTDVRLSEAFLRFGHDLAVGRVSPLLIDSLWDGVPPVPNLVAALSRAVQRGDVGGALRSLRPPDGRYAALRVALLRYRAIADRGGWPAVPDGPDLQAGDTGARVMALRERLSMTERLSTPAHAPVFDADLAAALRRFQVQVGILPDGVAGPMTRAALNVPVEQRIAILQMNLERWRWAPRALGSRYVIVNIPAYTLELHDGDSTTVFRAIVGRRERPTPITNAWMDGITFGPEWNVPRTIAVQEVVPLERAHPGYLRDGGFRVLRARTGVPVDPDSVDWRTVDTAAFPFRFVQRAGPQNPLGTIRFDVRDPFNVAIHDTPQRQLFGDRVRIFSHGCVRVDRAPELAAQLLPDWSVAEIRSAQAGPPGRTVALDRRVRVLLTYHTAWVNADGGVAFRDDVYGWDEELEHALLRRAELPTLSAGMEGP